MTRYGGKYSGGLLLNKGYQIEIHLLKVLFTILQYNSNVVMCATYVSNANIISINLKHAPHKVLHIQTYHTRHRIGLILLGAQYKDYCILQLFLFQ